MLITSGPRFLLFHEARGGSDMSCYVALSMAWETIGHGLVEVSGCRGGDPMRQCPPDLTGSVTY